MRICRLWRPPSAFVYVRVKLNVHQLLWRLFRRAETLEMTQALSALLTLQFQNI